MTPEQKSPASVIPASVLPSHIVQSDFLPNLSNSSIPEAVTTEEESEETEEAGNIFNTVISSIFKLLKYIILFIFEILFFLFK